MMFCLNLDPTPLKLDDLRTLSVLVKKKVVEKQNEKTKNVRRVVKTEKKITSLNTHYKYKFTF